MKLRLIPKLAIEYHHPKGLKCETDMEYARIATEIAGEMEKLRIPDISAEGLKLIAVNVSMYFEDVVADAGIWRGFTDLMKKHYGRLIPFFDIDEDMYYADEPNLEAVKFIVWYTMLEVHHGRVANPESPVLYELAETAYKVLDKHFETVSVNENLKDYFAKPQFLDDFYKQRDILKWLCFGCYLTYVPNLENRLFNKAHELVENMHIGMNFAIYLAECLMPYANKIGPLGILPQEWAAAILQANGNDDAAEKVREQRDKTFRGYKVASAEIDKSITLQDVDGETFTITSDELNNPEPEIYEHKIVFASFVKYGERWYLNGNMASGNNQEIFDAQREDYEGKEKLGSVYEKLRKESSLYYFADTKSLKEFLLKNLPFDEDVKKNFSLPDGHENIALYIPADNHDDFQILPDAALCIKDERNPYYNQKVALNQAFNLALSLDEEVRDYIIDHHLLPDATINSSKGIKRGNEIVQQNFKFITRAVISRL